MNIGNKIFKYRKKLNLSQEQLAEKIGVTRQTISKWELEETTPDIKQAKQLSKLFNISLDELTNNDIKNVLVEKVNNTERLLKIIGLLLIISIIGLIVINIRPIRDRKIKGKYNIYCTLENERYTYEIEYNKNFQIINEGGDAFIPNHIDIENYNDANKSKAHIEDWFKEHNGSCNVK